MSLVERVDAAIAKAEKGESKLVGEVFNVPGLSGRKIQIILNELCSPENTKYLEIGINDGKTFCAAMYKNPGFGYACDLWDAGKAEAFKRRADGFNLNYKLLHQNCWTINRDELRDLNVYFFDGCHNVYDHAEAPVFFNDCMAEEYVFLVDDWFTKCSDSHNRMVNDVTQEALEKAGIQIVKKWDLGTGWNSDGSAYWNGLGVYVLKRKEQG